MLWTASTLQTLAQEHGFLACGVTSLDPVPHGDALDAWLAKGYAGTMRYLHRQAKKRKEPARIVAGAKSVIVVLENYFPPVRDLSVRPSVRPSVWPSTRKARTTTAPFLPVSTGSVACSWSTEPRSRMRSPIRVRSPSASWPSARAWAGSARTPCSSGPARDHSSSSAAIFTDLELQADQPFELDRCGSCTRCLEACPTGAFVEERVLDATRCLSFLTIEWKGEIPPEMAAHAEGWAFGCDICNDVCPWNERFAEPTARPEYVPNEAPDRADPDYFERMSDAEFAALFGDTPLERPGLKGMRRNWRVAFRHSPPV